jgi:hypothetical protein
MRRYALIVGTEFGVAGVGAAAIAVAGHAGYLAPWICLVVGVHFWPMAPVLQNRSLVVLGALLVAVAVMAVLLSGRSALAPSAVTGVGAGVALLGFASRELLRLSSVLR